VNYSEDDIKYVMKVFSVDEQRSVEMLNKGLNIKYLQNGLKKETEAELASIRSSVEETAKRIVDEELKD